MTEILPCPFCGHAPRIERGMDWIVKCGDYDCQAEGPYAPDTRDSAIDAWNRRALPPPPTEKDKP